MLFYLCRKCLVLGGLLVVLLLLLSGFVRWQLWQRVQWLDAEQQKQVYLTDKLIKMGFEMPKLTTQEELSLALASLQQRLMKREKVQSHFNQTIGYNVEGFAAYLTDFARYSFLGVWLNKIEIEGADDHVMLTGSASETNFVTKYLSNLHGSPRFTNKQFKYLKISQDDGAQTHIDFVTSTQKQDTDADEKEEA